MFKKTYHQVPANYDELIAFRPSSLDQTPSSESQDTHASIPIVTEIKPTMPPTPILATPLSSPITDESTELKLIEGLEFDGLDFKSLDALAEEVTNQPTLQTDAQDVMLSTTPFDGIILYDIPQDLISSPQLASPPTSMPTQQFDTLSSISLTTPSLSTRDKRKINPPPLSTTSPIVEQSSQQLLTIFGLFSSNDNASSSNNINKKPRR